jgi:hypothetical protein
LPHNKIYKLIFLFLSCRLSSSIHVPCGHHFYLISMEIRMLLSATVTTLVDFLIAFLLDCNYQLCTMIFHNLLSKCVHVYICVPLCRMKDSQPYLVSGHLIYGVYQH